MNRWSSDIPLEDRLSTLEISKDELPKTTTLGIKWEARKDVFTFQVEPPDVDKAPTKRNVLSAIGSLFDPLQSLEPLTVRAKIIMQELWMAGVGWDELLPDDLNATVGEVGDGTPTTVRYCCPPLSSPSESTDH